MTAGSQEPQEPDFTMFPHVEQPPRPRPTGASWALWVVAAVTIFAGFFGAAASSGSDCGADAQCALREVGVLAGSVFGLFVGGCLVVAGFAVASRAARRERAEEQRVKDLLGG